MDKIQSEAGGLVQTRRLTLWLLLLLLQQSLLELVSRCRLCLPLSLPRSAQSIDSCRDSNSNFGLGRVSGLPIAYDLAKVVIPLPPGGSDDQPLTLR
jgi:hypothetical protein